MFHRHLVVCTGSSVNSFYSYRWTAMAISAILLRICILLLFLGKYNQPSSYFSVEHEVETHNNATQQFITYIQKFAFLHMYPMYHIRFNVIKSRLNSGMTCQNLFPHLLFCRFQSTYLKIKIHRVSTSGVLNPQTKSHVSPSYMLRSARIHFFLRPTVLTCIIAVP